MQKRIMTNEEELQKTFRKNEENLKQKCELSPPSSGLKDLRNKYSGNGERATNLWNAPSAVDFAELKLGIKLDDWTKELH